MFIYCGVKIRTGHRQPHRAGWLWSWIPSVLLPPLGRIEVKAITSLRLKQLNPPFTGYQKCNWVTLDFWPVPRGLKNNKTPLAKLSREKAGWLWSKDMRASNQCDLPLCLSSSHLPLTISCCQDDGAAQQPERRKGFVMARSRCNTSQIFLT